MQSTSSTVSGAPASPAEPWIAIIANAFSGAKSNRRRVDALVRALRGHDLSSRCIWDPYEAQALLSDPQQTQGCRCIVIAGGDGTVSSVLSYRPQPPIAVMPLGNENLFAKQYGFTGKVRDLADAVVAGSTRRIDTARCGNRMFSLMASVGLDADVVHRVADWRRQGDSLRRIRHTSYVMPTLASLRNYSYPQLEIEADEDRNFGTHILVFNIPRYAGNMQFCPQALDDDGCLDWIIFKRPGLRYLWQYVWNVYRGRVHRIPDAVVGRAKKIRIISRVPAPVQIDGDPIGFTPADIEVLPSTVSVIRMT